jgi:guanylate kinase
MSNSSSVNFHPDGTLFIVSGPSGAGKTTLINRVREELAPMGIELHFSVSHTTRLARSGEIEGNQYYFVTRDEFERMSAAGEFIEWAHVHSNLYGTSKKEVQTRLDRGEDVILDIDVQGARQIASNEDLNRHSLSVFVFPPSFDELEKRLKNRGLNSDGEIHLRLEKAWSEIENSFDVYEYVIINDDLKNAAECLKSAIVARKLKSRSAVLALREMAKRFKEERSARVAQGN